MKQLIEQTALAQGKTPHHDKVYFELQDDRMHVYAAGGEAVQSFSTYPKSYFQDFELHCDQPVRALIDISSLEPFEWIDWWRPIELCFFPGVEITSQIQIRANLIIGIAGKDLDVAPHQIRNKVFDRFDASNRFLNEKGTETLPVEIETTVDRVEKLMSIAKEMEKPAYPITVKQGKWKIELEEEDSGNWVKDNLAADSVVGPDINNTYTKGCEEVFRHLSGQITLQTAPHHGPLVVTKTTVDGVTYRHIIRSPNEGQKVDF